MKSKFLPLFVASCLLHTAHSATITWVGTTTGDWTTPSNWSNAAAPAVGNAYVVTGSGKIINSPNSGNVTFAGDSLTISNGAKMRLLTSTNGGGQTDTFGITNLTIDGATVSPATSNGTVTQSLTNQVALANAAVVELNDTAGNSAFMTFAAGYSGSGTLAIQRSGNTGTGRGVTINGLTSAYSGAVTTGGFNSGDPTGVTIGTNSGWGGGNLTIGQWSTVTLNLNATGTGSVTVNANGTLSIGSTTGAFYHPITNNGTVNFARTTSFTFPDVISGDGGVSQTSTSATILGGDNTYTGNTSITAGTLSLGHANAVGSTGIITVSGGTLQFTGKNNTDYSSRISIPTATTATFDTGVRSVTFANAIGTGTAAVTQTGIGTLTLAGGNSYSGTTTVSAGRLDIVGSLSSPVSVASGATLSGTGFTVLSVTLASGSNVLISNTGLVQGNGVTATNVNIIPDAASVVAGSNLLDVIGYGSGPIPLTTDFNVTGFRSPTIADDNGALKITLAFTTGARSWAGTTGTWDLGTSTPWTGGDQKFFSGDTVTFPDIAADNVVTLTGILAPASVAVTNNAAFNHTFSGTGSIVGTTALTKSGAGTLTISTANTYSGGTTLNGGTLTASATNALGIGPVTISSGTLSLNGGALGNAISGAGDISVLGTTNSTLSGDLTGLTGNINISATGTGKLGVTTGATLPSTVTVNVNSGSTLYATGASTIAGTINLLGTGNTENLGALRLDDGTQVTGSVVLGANSFIGSNTGSGTISSVISETGGARSLTKQGGGTVVLSGTNTYTGTTFLAGGTLQLGSSTALPTTAAINFTGTGSTFDTGSTNPTLASFTANTMTTSINHAVRGSGTLTVNGASDLVIQTPGGATLGNALTMDMSGLANFVYSSSTKNVSFGGVGNNRSATVNLPHNATFTAANFNIQDSSYATSNVTKTATVTLGQNTTINASTVNFQTNGGDSAAVRFRAVVSPTLKIRATDTTSRAAWNVGARTASGAATGTTLVDLTSNGGSNLDALVTTLALGNVTATGTSTTTFQMARGTLDATLISVGFATTGGTSTVNFSVAGGTVTTPTLTLGNRASGTLTSSVSLNSGGTIAATTIQSGTGTATRNFNWNDGTIRNAPATNLTVSIPSLKLANTGTHTLEVDSAQTATVSAAISDATVGSPGALTKSGDGLATLSGANTYTGDTLVTGGTLSLGSAYLADGADVRLTNGGILNLTHGVSDTVDEFYIDGVRQLAGTWGATGSGAAHESARITGSGFLQVTTGSSYDAWAASKSLAGANALASADPDNDGRNNLGEFAFDGAPLSGINDGKIVERIVPGGLTLTIPVRLNAGVFASDANGLFATKDGVTYRIQGSTDLTNWTMTVTEITATPNAPTLSTGWEYRTFQVTTTGNQKSFIRAKVTDVVPAP